MEVYPNSVMETLFVEFTPVNETYGVMRAVH